MTAAAAAAAAALSDARGRSARITLQQSYRAIQQSLSCTPHVNRLQVSEDQSTLNFLISV